MWKFFAHDDGMIRPNLHEPCDMICDAFVWVLRQEAGHADMTVLARMGLTKLRWGKPAVESIERAWRFSQRDAVAVAVYAATRVHDLYAQFAPHDARVATAIAAASAGDKQACEDLMSQASLAAAKARESGRGAAEYAAESARAAALATCTQDDGSALQAAAYSLVYAIQAGDRANVGNAVTHSIERWLLTKLRQMSSSGQ